jgi:integrase
MDVLWSFIHARRERDGVVNATINRALEIVRRVLNLAHHEWGWLQRLPRIRMLKEPKRRIRFLTREEADRLNEALPEHLRPVVQFALASGCRMSEIPHLEWRRVDFGRRVAWLDPGTTKNGEGRGIPLNNDAVLALRAVHGSHPRWCSKYQGEELMELGGWKSYEMVLRYAHLAPEHLSSAAQRIERVWGVVDADSTISLRQTA